MVIIVKAGKQHGYGETLVSNAQTEKEQGKNQVQSYCRAVK